MSSPLPVDRSAVSDLCQEYGVKRLVLFGSATTDHFDAAHSDVDFIVEFRDDVANRFDAYFGLKESLEALFNRPVDLIALSALENPYFAASVSKNAQELYAA